MKRLLVLWWTVLLFGQSTNATTLICGGNDYIEGFYISEVTLSGIGNNCSKMEEVGIAHLLQDGMNYYMEQVISGIATSSNKICMEPIVDLKEGKHRSLFQESAPDGHNVTGSPQTSRDLFDVSLLTFIFRGTGKCRMCIPDDGDSRRLFGKMESSSSLLLDGISSNKRYWQDDKHATKRKLGKNEHKKTIVATGSGARRKLQTAWEEWKRTIRLEQRREKLLAREREREQKRLENWIHRLDRQREKLLERRQGRATRLKDKVESGSKRLDSALRRPQTRRNYEKKVLRAFARLLGIMEEFIGYQLTTLARSQYIFTRGHCLMHQHLLVTAKLKWTNFNHQEEEECFINRM